MQPPDETVAVWARYDTLDDRSHRLVEPLLELGVRLKEMRHQEMHQRPQFHQAVLQWSPCQQKTALRGKVEKCLPSLRTEVLDMVCLVEDEIFPSFPSERLLVLDD